jgi:protein TonB
MTSEGIMKIPQRASYGAIELKEFIRKNTYKAFLITISLFLLLFLLYWIYGKATAVDPNAALTAPISKISLTAPTQQSDQIEDAPPPPPTEAVVDIATAAKAGTPVPVPDADIKEELKEFADVDDLTKSLSKEKGDIVDFDQVQEIDLGEKKLDVGKIEDEPGIDDFIPVEKEPVVDLLALQKSIVYPEMARKAGIEGQVIVRVLVGKDGKPKKSVVQYTDSKMLDKAAKAAVMKQIFTPAIQNGRAITCWVSIPIKFKLR